MYVYLCTYLLVESTWKQLKNERQHNKTSDVKTSQKVFPNPLVQYRDLLSNLYYQYYIK